MRQSEIKAGRWYRGRTGEPRRVEYVWRDGLVEWSRGNEAWRDCSLRTFARWAVAEIEEGGRDGDG